MKTALRRKSAITLRTDSGELECCGAISAGFAKDRKYFCAIVRRSAEENWPKELSFATLRRFFVRDHNGCVARFPFSGNYGVVAGLEDLDRARDKRRRFTHVYGEVMIAYTSRPLAVNWRNKHVDTGD